MATMAEDTARLSAGASSTDTIHRAPPPQVWHLKPSPPPRIKIKDECSLPSLEQLSIDRILDNITTFEPKSFPAHTKHLLPKIAARWEKRTENMEYRRFGVSGYSYEVVPKKKKNLGSELFMVSLMAASMEDHDKDKMWTMNDDVPINEIFHYCQANTSPLVKIHHNLPQPRTFDLITTLDLSSNPYLTDENIVSLRNLSNLSFLYTMDSKLTDKGIQRITSTLDLPSNTSTSSDNHSHILTRWHGPWRLRGWYLDRSPLITDKSLRSFLKFPLLNVISINRTGITSEGIESIQRQTPNFDSKWWTSEGSGKGGVGERLRLKGTASKDLTKDWERLREEYHEIWPGKMCFGVRKNDDDYLPRFILNVKAAPPSLPNQRFVTKRSSSSALSNTPGAGMIYIPGGVIDLEAAPEPDEYGNTPFRRDPDKDETSLWPESRNRFGAGVKHDNGYRHGGTWTSCLDLGVESLLWREPPGWDDLSKRMVMGKVSRDQPTNNKNKEAVKHRNPFALTKRAAGSISNPAHPRDNFQTPSNDDHAVQVAYKISKTNLGSAYHASSSGKRARMSDEGGMGGGGVASDTTSASTSTKKKRFAASQPMAPGNRSLMPKGASLFRSSQ